MFTGLVRDIGTIASIARSEGGVTARIQTKLDKKDLEIGASVSCSGVCLTIVALDGDVFTIEASPETLAKTNIGAWEEGQAINLEPSLRLGDALGGHFVFGHVDGLADIVSVERVGDSREIVLKAPQDLKRFLAPKGSVTLDGVSLTVNTVTDDRFTIMVIPHTWMHTTFGSAQAGRTLHIEIDMIARYTERLLGARTHAVICNFATIEDLVAELKAGRPIVLVDGEDRENEGDVVIAADFADANAITFMAKQASGLICLALAPEIADRLGLALIGKRDNAHHDTAFLMPIEAKHGVTTGISAEDRARTVAVAIDPNSTPADIATPGHVFPIRAHGQSVHVRPGHTEAGVELCRLAGLTPAAVICEIMNEDGTMARRPQLEIFAKRWKLKLGAIDALVAFLEKQGHG